MTSYRAELEGADVVLRRRHNGRIEPTVLSVYHVKNLARTTECRRDILATFAPISRPKTVLPRSGVEVVLNKETESDESSDESIISSDVSEDDDSGAENEVVAEMRKDTESADAISANGGEFENPGLDVTVPSDGFYRHPDCVSVLVDTEVYALDLRAVLEAIGAMISKKGSSKKRNVFAPKGRRACEVMAETFDLSLQRAFVRTEKRRETTRVRNNGYEPKRLVTTYYLPVHFLPLFLCCQAQTRRKLNLHSEICRCLLESLRACHTVDRDNDILRFTIRQLDANITRASVYADEERAAGGVMYDLNRSLVSEVKLLIDAKESQKTTQKILAEAEETRRAVEFLQQSIKTDQGNLDTARSALLMANQQKVKITKLREALAEETRLRSVDNERARKRIVALEVQDKHQKTRISALEEAVKKVEKKQRRQSKKQRLLNKTLASAIQELRSQSQEQQMAPPPPPTTLKRPRHETPGNPESDLPPSKRPRTAPLSATKKDPSSSSSSAESSSDSESSSSAS